MFTAQHGHEQVALVRHEAGAVLSNLKRMSKPKLCVSGARKPEHD